MSRGCPAARRLRRAHPTEVTAAHPWAAAAGNPTWEDPYTWRISEFSQTLGLVLSDLDVRRRPPDGQQNRRDIQERDAPVTARHHLMQRLSIRIARPFQSTSRAQHEASSKNHNVPSERV